MKIAKVKAHALAGSVETPLYFGIGPFPTFYATVVEITTDEGLTGFGECIARMAPQVTKVIVEQMLAPDFVGKDPWDVEGVWEAMFARLRRWGHHRGFVMEAISGIDVALWDILGRATRMPVYKLLGGCGRDRVRCYASSVYFAGIDQMVAQAKAQQAKGHVAIKVKIGRPESMGGIHMDAATVKAIREAVGPGMEIFLDANGAYDAATAIRVCRRLEPFDIGWLEEPVPSDDVSGYELVRKSTSIPIACGESEFGEFGFRDLIERRAVDILQPDIARAGGFTGSRRAAALAHAYNLQVAPHTGFSGAPCHLAALHLAAAVPNFYTYESMFITNPLTDLFTEPLPQPKDGHMAVPQRPGLGRDLDPEKVARYTVA